MNERIRELYEEAKSFYLTDEYILPPSEEDCEMIGQKFAELIIAECCVALHPMLRDMISRTQAVDMIVRHFRDEQDD